MTAILGWCAVVALVVLTAGVWVLVLVVRLAGVNLCHRLARIELSFDALCHMISCK